MAFGLPSRLSRPKLHRGITPMSEIKNFSSLDLLRIFAYRLIINVSGNFRPHKNDQSKFRPVNR